MTRQGAVRIGKYRHAISFHMNKLVEAVHYICSNVGPEDRLGAVKLNKILYYADMLSYARTDRAITGATYVKQFRGPVPTQVVAAIAQLESDTRLNVTHVSVFEALRRQFEAIGITDTKVFDAGELDTINETIRFVCGHTAPEISEISHHVVWKAADIGEVLPYDSFLVTSLGDIGESDITIANEAIKAASRGGNVYA